MKEAYREPRKFYPGMNYNGGGIQIAKRLIPKLEEATGCQCTSRWVWSEAHEHKDFRLTIAATDLSDIARADFLIVAPLTGTSRGVHVEIGLGIALDKPVFLYRPKEFDGTGFDSLCLPWRKDWVDALERILAEPSSVEVSKISVQGQGDIPKE